MLIQASQQFEEMAAEEDKFDKCEDHLDSLLLQASQQFEAAQDSCNKQQGRFDLSVTTQGLMEKVNRAVPANTHANIKWIATIWSDWRGE